MGKRLSNYEEEEIVFNQKRYETLLAETYNYVKVKPIDAEKTIHLINRIREDRGIIAFTSAIGTISRIQLFRIYKDGSNELKNTTVAGILSAKLPGCNVTLDDFMDAQGKIRIDKQEEYKRIYKKELRQILLYSLLQSGCEMALQEENKGKRPENEDQSKFSIRITQPKESVWDFEIRTFSYTGRPADISDVINELLSHLVSASVHKRESFKYSLIIDNEFVYRELKEKAETIRLPNEVSIILISAFHRKVIEEYNIPRPGETDGNTILFPNLVILAETSIYYTLEEKYKMDCQAIIMDDLLQSGNAIRITNTENPILLFRFINLHSDLSFCITEKSTKKDTRIFFIKDISDYTDYSDVSRSIHDWLLETIASFHTGKFDAGNKVSLVVNQPALFHNISKEMSTVKIPERISVILIDTNRREISNEKNNPWNSTNPEQKSANQFNQKNAGA